MHGLASSRVLYLLLCGLVRDDFLWSKRLCGWVHASVGGYMRRWVGTCVGGWVHGSVGEYMRQWVSTCDGGCMSGCMGEWVLVYSTPPCVTLLCVHVKLWYI